MSYKQIILLVISYCRSILYGTNVHNNIVAIVRNQVFKECKFIGRHASRIAVET